MECLLCDMARLIPMNTPGLLIWEPHTTSPMMPILLLYTSLFICQKPDFVIYILIYVDDILVTGSNATEIQLIISALQASFAVKDLGNLHYFLGIEALWCSNGVYLTQRKYIADLLQKTKMDHAKPCSSPMASTCRLTSTDGEPFEDVHLFRSVVGSLQYLAFTRPDLAFSVHKVSKFMHKPLDSQSLAVKRILRYLKHSIYTGLLITQCKDHTLQAFSDSDWAAERDDRRSVGAYCIYMGTNLISWSCKQQQMVARSSTEAEYKAIANAAAELSWFQSILRELGLPSQCIPTLWCDNIGATYLTSNPKFHARTKHIEIDFHFVRDKVCNKELVVKFISSKDQLADALTKPLPPNQFRQVMINLNVRELPFRLRGRVEDHVTAAHIQDTSDDLQDEDQDIDQAATVTKPMITLRENSYFEKRKI
ncbi:hypothetical protein DKX38_018193 [Salix brachista]|uniref:Reverse transcriptase Ty1/copia-type domain-containing protein n=1 Tax=Salix brachista TaxID=2182728 RepID=A0A5N5KMD5_9ROSI|nr:hypothetical protein DKX38_018193 [Salix brachista]